MRNPEKVPAGPGVTARKGDVFDRDGLAALLGGHDLVFALGAVFAVGLFAFSPQVRERFERTSAALTADRNGVELATRAGFDPYGLAAALQQLRTATPDDPLFSLSLSTHPPAQLRLDQIELAMGNRLDGFAGKPPVPLALRLAR